MDGSGRTFFAASEGFSMESLFAFAMALWDLAGEFPFAGQDRLLAETGHVRVQLFACNIDQSIIFAAV